jgi:hypothetical protein
MPTADFVDIGEGVVLFRQVADGVDRGDVAVHRIDAFERDQLGQGRVGFGQQLFQMFQVVVTEHALFRAGIADAGNHAGVVQLVGKDHAAGQDLGERRERASFET